MFKKLTIVLALLGFMVFSTGLVSAQEEEMVDEDSFIYTIGEVVSRTAKSITILEYTDDESQVNSTYIITEKTEFENIGSLDEVLVGDEIDVLYIINNEQNEAVVIAKIVEEENSYE